jgi:hypothetical protein
MVPIPQVQVQAVDLNDPDLLMEIATRRTSHACNFCRGRRRRVGLIPFIVPLRLQLTASSSVKEEDPAEFVYRVSSATENAFTLTQEAGCPRPRLRPLPRVPYPLHRQLVRRRQGTSSLPPLACQDSRQLLLPTSHRWSACVIPTSNCFLSDGMQLNNCMMTQIGDSTTRSMAVAMEHGQYSYFDHPLGQPHDAADRLPYPASIADPSDSAQHVNPHLFPRQNTPHASSFPSPMTSQQAVHQPHMLDGWTDALTPQPFTGGALHYRVSPYGTQYSDSAATPTGWDGQLSASNTSGWAAFGVRTSDGAHMPNG